MLPYFSQSPPPPENLVELKFKELVLSLLSNKNNDQFLSYLNNLSNDQLPSIEEIMYNNYTFNLTLDEYAVARVQEDVTETSPDRVKSAIEGLIVNAYRSLTLDEDERYAGFMLLSRQIWNIYMEKIPQERIKAIGLPPLAEIDREMLIRLLDPEHGVSPEERAVLRTKLPSNKLPPPPGTNAPPAKISASISR